MASLLAAGMQTATWLVALCRDGGGGRFFFSTSTGPHSSHKARDFRSLPLASLIAQLVVDAALTAGCRAVCACVLCAVCMICVMYVVLPVVCVCVCSVCVQCVCVVLCVVVELASCREL
jgi:hypothetical protein